MKNLLVTLPLVAASTLVMAAGATLTDAQIDAAFAKADKDSNGTLNPAEAAKFGISAKVFKAANPDNDGTLDKKEFAAAIEAQFNAANPDNDGTLDWKEAQKAGIHSKKTFEGANPDKDGTLDMSEYLAALLAQAK